MISQKFKCSELNGALVFKDFMIFVKPRKQFSTSNTKLDGDMIIVLRYCII